MESKDLHLAIHQSQMNEELAVVTLYHDKKMYTIFGEYELSSKTIKLKYNDILEALKDIKND